MGGGGGKQSFNPLYGGSERFTLGKRGGGKKNLMFVTIASSSVSVKTAGWYCYAAYFPEVSYLGFFHTHPFIINTACPLNTEKILLRAECFACSSQVTAKNAVFKKLITILNH